MDDPYKDPSQMTDEELDAALAGKVVEDPKDPPTEDPKDPPAPSNDPVDPPADPPADPVEDPKDPPADPPADPPKEDPTPPVDDPKDPPAPSPREAKRIQALIEKMKLGSQPPAPQQPVQPPAPSPEVKPINFRELIDAPDEVYATLEKAAEEYGKSLTPQQPAQPQQPSNQPSDVDQLNSIRWEMGVKFDTPQVLAKYPRLDPKSPDFDPISADALNMEYLHTVGLDRETGLVKNPNISYSEFVEARYELANLLADEKIQASTTNIKKQAAATGLRPDGSQSKRLNLNQAPENMTDEELDAAIAQGVPTH